MTAVRIPTAMKVDTRPTVHPSLSMKYLLFIISAVTGLILSICKPRTVDLPYYFPRLNFVLCSVAFTLVKRINTIMSGRLIRSGFIAINNILMTVVPGFVPAGTSGKYPGNALPGPEGSAGLVFCHLSIRDTASKERLQVLWPTWHLSAFPVALSCKAQTVVSYLLY